MGGVQTVLRGAAGPANNNWPVVTVEAVAESKKKRSGVLVFVEQPGTVTGDKPLKRRVFALVHTPTPVATKGVEADLNSFGKSHCIIAGQAGLKEKTQNFHEVLVFKCRVGRNPCRVKGFNKRPKGVKKTPFLS